MLVVLAGLALSPGLRSSSHPPRARVPRASPVATVRTGLLVDEEISLLAKRMLRASLEGGDEGKSAVQRDACAAIVRASSALGTEVDEHTASFRQPSRGPGAARQRSQSR